MDFANVSIMMLSHQKKLQTKYTLMKWLMFIYPDSCQSKAAATYGHVSINPKVHWRRGVAHMREKQKKTGCLWMIIHYGLLSDRLRSSQCVCVCVHVSLSALLLLLLHNSVERYLEEGLYNCYWHTCWTLSSSASEIYNLEVPERCRDTKPPCPSSFYISAEGHAQENT